MNPILICCDSLEDICIWCGFNSSAANKAETSQDLFFYSHIHRWSYWGQVSKGKEELYIKPG